MENKKILETIEALMEELQAGDMNAYHRAILAKLEQAKERAIYLVRDDENEAKQGKEYFEAKAVPVEKQPLKLNLLPQKESLESLQKALDNFKKQKQELLAKYAEGQAKGQSNAEGSALQLKIEEATANIQEWENEIERLYPKKTDNIKKPKR